MRNLPFLVLLILWLPSSISAQQNVVSLFAEDGLSSGPQGTARIRGFRAEVGLKGPLGGVVRWSKRTRAFASDGGANPTTGWFLEMGGVFRLGGAYRVAPFADVMVGVSREKKPYREIKTKYTSASASLGMELRLYQFAFMRVGYRRQEVFGTNRSDGRRGDSNGVFIGVGISTR